MKVIKNGAVVEMPYEDVCHDLGFIPEVHFVEITTRRTIAFTCGKPHEISALYDAVINKGYKPSAKLTNYFLCH